MLKELLRRQERNNTIGRAGSAISLNNRDRWQTNQKIRNKTASISSQYDSLHSNPTENTKKLLELINEFSIVNEYLVNMQKSYFITTKN